ncbi:MAG TPA: helix-turn-helix transcriptional regulator [Polyangiaceae bacterium]|nr:helix-turn-helix transcriptional regulator [Polyangiaceae bacterium]
MARSTAKKASKPIPTHGVHITDPAFVPEYDDEGIIKNDPDSPYDMPPGAKWRRRVPRERVGLAYARRWAELTQVEASERLGVSQGEISRIENAGDTLQLATIRAYVEALGYELVVSVAAKDGTVRRVL